MCHVPMDGRDRIVAGFLPLLSGSSATSGAGSVHLTALLADLVANSVYNVSDGAEAMAMPALFP